MIKTLNLNKLLQNDLIITGGHFLIHPDGSIEQNLGTLKSFEFAVELYKKGKDLGKTVFLGILVNNIGTLCENKVCSVMNKSSEIIFPETYIDILEKYNIKLSELMVFKEKHMRNRGKKEFMKLIGIRKDIFLQNGNYWLLCPKLNSRILLTRHSDGDKYGVPACPLIMCAYAFEQAKFAKKSLNIYYLGDDNYVNVPNHYIIEKGKVVAKKFGCKLDIMNLYVKDEDHNGEFDNISGNFG